MARIVIDPVTRIEGHLKIEVEVKDGKVVDARCSGGLFRGFEIFLNGRDPRDASQLTQRICGVCPTAHATASVRCLDSAFKVKPTARAGSSGTWSLPSNYTQSHILHFYHLAALDYVKGPDTEPFIPRYEGDYRLDKATNDVAVGQYLEGLKMRALAQEMVATWGGKCLMWPVSWSVDVPPPPRLKKSQPSRKNWPSSRNSSTKPISPPCIWWPGAYKDLFGVGAGCKNFMSHGVFPLDDDDKTCLLKPGTYTQGKDYSFDPKEIWEFVKYSWFDNSTTGLNPG